MLQNFHFLIFNFELYIRIRTEIWRTQTKFSKIVELIYRNQKFMLLFTKFYNFVFLKDLKLYWIFRFGFAKILVEKRTYRTYVIYKIRM